VADAPRVRRAREDDVPALAPLVYSTAGDMYRRVAGSHDRALRIIAADLRRNGLGATWVAELDEMVAGAMVAYPYAEAPAGTRRFVVTILAYTPPWRWPSVLRLLWKGHRRAPSHPADWLYVDALATAPDRRRRGVASALLAHAERTAVNNGLSAVVLDTPDSNEAALALYESAGFRVHEVLPAKPPIPAGVILVKEVAT
jgi:ribosomal protein S18 acetylase RimI-like enzyme